MDASIRQRTESIEAQLLAPWAAKAGETRGREHPDIECDIRTAFQRDRDRIIHSKAFRRLKHKTQVFLSPEGDHYRTRLTHTLEVAQIARTIARALRLNEDLTESIALGHDLGHTPFGHCGETALDAVWNPPGFRHSEQSLRVVDLLEVRSSAYPGLNLTAEVRDGIANHTGDSPKPFTLEGEIVRLSDRIAYLNHDMDDAVRAGVLSEADLPADITRVLGPKRRRIDLMVHDVINASAEAPRVAMSTEIAEATSALRDYMFANVYVDSIAKKEETKARTLLQSLFRHYLDTPEELAEALGHDLEPGGAARAAIDYIAGMTDRFAVAEYERHFVPGFWTR